MSTPRRVRAPSQVQALASGARARWTALSPRERRLVALALVLVLATVLWLVLLRPALRVQAQAPQRIEQLRATLARTQAQADELGRLAGMPALQAQVADPADALRQWLKAHGAQGQVRSLPGSVSVELQHLPAWALVDLARTARTQWAMDTSSAKLKLGSDGLLSGSIGLRATRPASGSGEQSSQGGPESP